MHDFRHYQGLVLTHADAWEVRTHFAGSNLRDYYWSANTIFHIRIYTSYGIMGTYPYALIASRAAGEE